MFGGILSGTRCLLFNSGVTKHSVGIEMFFHICPGGGRETFKASVIRYIISCMFSQSEVCKKVKFEYIAI